MPGVCLLLTESGLQAKQDLANQQGAEINYADPEVRSWTLGKKPRCCCGQYNQLDNSKSVVAQIVSGRKVLELRAILLKPRSA